MTHTNFTQEELANEEWKDVIGYDYKYQISDLGRFRRLTSFHKRNIDTITLGSFDARGYLRVSITKGGKSVSKKLHRLVAEYFIDGYSEDLTVNHIDFVKNNNRKTNLELMTVAENALDYISKIIKNTSSSSYIGVNFHKNLKKWNTRVEVDGKRHSVGTYSTEQEAIQAIKDYNNGLNSVNIGKGAREKLTEDEKIELLSLVGKDTKRNLAKKFNISYTTVFNIIERCKNK